MSDTEQNVKNENILGVNPDDYRTCKRCKRLKHISEYRPIPGGRMSPVCSDCQAEKARETKVLGKDEGSQRAWIVGELIKQYRSTDKQTDKIRCLEALAKLLPPDTKTPLDAPSVIQSLMKSLEAKRRKSAEKKEDAESGTDTQTK
jgi:hypothetical protein